MSYPNSQSFDKAVEDLFKAFDSFMSCEDIIATDSKKVVSKQAIFDLIKVTSREAAIASFTAYNKTRFKQQMTGSEFLTSYSRSTPKLDCNHEGLKYLRYEYIFGIPFMLLQPKTWNKIYQGSNSHGLRSKHGIIISTENAKDEQTIAHEIAIAVIDYWKTTNTFKASTDAKLDRIRCEGIAYLLTNPGALNSLSEDDACYYLSSYYTTYKDLDPNIAHLSKLIAKVDQGGMNITRLQMARTLLVFDSYRTIYGETTRLANLKTV
jgi:hypothetical protein